MILQDIPVTQAMRAVYVLKLSENVVQEVLVGGQTAALLIMAIQQMACTRATLWIKIEFSSMLTLH